MAFKSQAEAFASNNKLSAWGALQNDLMTQQRERAATTIKNV